MDDAGAATLRWDTGRSRWSRRARSDATVVAANGPAMLVRATLHPDLHVGSRVDVELAEGRGTVEIRHVAPTGDIGIALVGVEFVATDEALAAYVARLALESTAGGEPDRWWWQRDG